MPLRCYTCNGNHTCRECPVEKKISGHMRKIIGDYMENHVANTVKCPKCNCKSLYVLGNNSPSLDLKCKKCPEIKIECKSKCLSVRLLPNDLILNHGSFIDYKSRQKEGLHFVIVIYKIDRIRKELTIRKILFVDDSYIKTNDNFTVKEKCGTTLSNIFIRDHTRLPILTSCGAKTFSYKDYFEKIVKEVL